MKNFVKLFLIIAFAAVIGFSFISCGDKGGDGDGGNKTPTVTIENTDGRLTITGLESYNNKYVGAFTNPDFSPPDPDLIAADGLTVSGENITMKGGKVINGSVELKVWTMEEDKAGKYTGSDSYVQFMVFIFNSETWVMDDVPTVEAVGDVTVNFINGVGSDVFVKN